MGKTALEMTPEQWLAYRPGGDAEETTPEMVEKTQKAWKVARSASELLRNKFGARRVLVFGSLAQGEAFTPWSDIDLAAWGIPSESYYRAVAAVTGLSSDFKIDLVEPDTCRLDLLEIIERQGVEI